MATTVVLTLLFLLLRVKVSISASPGDLYINGLKYTADGDITLYNGGSISIHATNSNHMCILLMTDQDDWTGAEPECKYTSGPTQSLYCEVGEKYTYSQGTYVVVCVPVCPPHVLLIMLLSFSSS